jgi:predicted AAA+ superfamily ATPase
VQRKITEYLNKWKGGEYRKPLVLQGARQVGKTYAVLEFGKNSYDNVAYFNFETDPLNKEAFEGDISPESLLPRLSRRCGQTITKGNTLIVFDEVQVCERALTSLKYFDELAPEYHVVALGSLLGVAVNRRTFSFPVGKVDIVTMYPMDFEEFLWAYDEREAVGKIRACFETDAPMDKTLHNALFEYYRLYLVVGGMPDCVAKYRATKDFLLLRHVQAMILESYLNDMSKYNTNNEIKKTRLVYDNIAIQLSKKNTRFQYKIVKYGGRASEFENAIEWLGLSGVTSKIYRVEQIQKPLENYRDIDAFKIYISDTGLLCAKKGIVAEDIIYASPDLNDFNGGLTENYVNNQLLANGYTRYYWELTNAEIEFILQRGRDLVPVEVKSGDARAESLNKYVKQFEPSLAIKISANNFGREGNKKTVPLYAAFCI